MPAALAAPQISGPEPGFPPIEIESIRWHPKAVRRRVRLSVASRLVPDAREGDIISGVRIGEIRPGSVELHLGEAIRIVELRR